MECPLFEAPKFLFFAEGVSPLIYYSHLSSILITAVVGFFVYLNNRAGLANRLMLGIALTFISLTTMLLITWTNNKSNVIMSAWSIYGLLYVLLSLLCYYFYSVFVTAKDISFKKKALLLPLIIPALILSSTNINLDSFDLTVCGATENLLFVTYYHLVAGIVFLLIAMEWIFKYRKNQTVGHSKVNVYMTWGILIFLLIILTNSFLASLLFNLGITTDYTLEQYALFGMTFFMSLLGYLMVRFQAFNSKLVAAQALVVGIIVVVASMLFFAQNLTVIVLNILSLLLVTLGGHFLVRSVKKEIKQREELEMLTRKLAAANDRLKELDKLKSEFVSIASHQMRSPLTSMRGYASMVLDGSYGSIPDKAKEAIQRIADSSAFMAKMIENYLNVSRIESGNMKYELSDFNLKLETEKVVDDKRQEAMKKGLLLTFKSNLQGQGIVHADIGKTLEIIHNLLNNALKYTPKGSIDVFVHDDLKKKKIYVDIHDSGIGMNPEDVTKLFGKFERAQNANSVNITGTGLGLYVARTMALAMKGEITAMSEGQGKGSTFRFELTEVM